MKGLEGMIRLSKWRLDEARKALVEAEAALARIDARIDAIARRLAAEQAVEAEPRAAFGYGAFAQASIARRAALRAERDTLETTRAARQDAVAEAFKELKKYELLEARRVEREKEERARRERSALDEIGARRHGRKA